MSAQDLGRFGHHQNPARDFVAEVSALSDLIVGVFAFTVDNAVFAERLDRALEFRVGGNLHAIDAKAWLRRIARNYEEFKKPTGLNWIELGALIEPLREDEASGVTLICDNPDGEPNNAVECYGDWTNWDVKRFDGETLADALRAAVGARAAAKADNVTLL